METVVLGSYLRKQEKLPLVQKAVIKVDVLKFFLQIAWETKDLDTKKYIILSKYLHEVGKMLGGWTKQLSKETPSF